MSDYKEQIGARIKAARILKGLTQDNLAEKLDVSTSCISRYETGVSIASVATHKRHVADRQWRSADNGGGQFRPCGFGHHHQNLCPRHPERRGRFGTDDG